MISSQDEFYNSVLDIKRTILEDDLSKMSEENLEKVFDYFEVEFAKLRDETNERVCLIEEISIIQYFCFFC
jgi:hypothetical protein